MNVILYSTHCPRCTVLEAKLNQAGIKYEVCEDLGIMQKKGFMSVPMLGVTNESGVEEILDFGAAVKWISAHAV